ncbi:MAG: CoA transferase subunit A [Candidatus Baldrarchaeia archaeon]
MAGKVNAEIEDKIMDAKEAVKKFISNGCHIGLGGFTVQRHPMELIREIIRQHKRNLVLYGCSQGIDADMLIGAKCVKRIEMAYVGDEPFVSPSPNFRRAIEEGLIEWEDYTNFGATLRFVAGALGIPFTPTKSMLGSDIITKWGIPAEVRKKAVIPDLHQRSLLSSPAHLLVKK